MLRKKFLDIFGRTPTDKEEKVLEYIKGNCYGDYLNVDQSVFVDYFCQYYYYCVSRCFV